jgi:hypothetical protein
MNDRRDDLAQAPRRLRAEGSEEDKRLLRAAALVPVPEAVKDGVRRALEARFADEASQTSGWRVRKIAAALALVLAAAGVAAAGWGPTLWQKLRGPSPAEKTHAAARAQNQPVDGVTAPKADLPPAPRPPATEAKLKVPTPPQAPTLQRPELDLPTFLSAGEAPERPATPPVVDPDRLIISRSGRAEVALVATAGRLRGEVRGRSLDLAFKDRSVSGRIGGDELQILGAGSERAVGHVGGKAIDFSFNPTDHGWRVDASLPNLNGRVRLDEGGLYFFPGCGEELQAVAGKPGNYQGICADGTSVRITLPRAFAQAAPAARLILLGMLLPEPDAGDPSKTPGLFPPP